MCSSATSPSLSKSCQRQDLPDAKTQQSGELQDQRVVPAAALLADLGCSVEHVRDLLLRPVVRRLLLLAVLRALVRREDAERVARDQAPTHCEPEVASPRWSPSGE
jgi:hypothetical protein